MAPSTQELETPTIPERFKTIIGTLLNSWPDAEIVEAADFPSAWDAVAQPCDMCICDLAMPGAEPLDGVARLINAAPDIPVLILTGSHDDALMLRLLEIGVNGFVQKDAGSKVMTAAIRLIEAGERRIPSRLLALMAPPAPSVKLTDQQRRVISLVAQGQSNKAIALKMGVAPSTVKTHLEQAMRHLDATSRLEAANRAREAGLI